jgi:hypothetical protein
MSEQFIYINFNNTPIFDNNIENFYNYVIDKLKEDGIMLSRSYAFEGGFSYKNKPELRFSGEYGMKSWKRTSLHSKVCRPSEVEWTLEEKEAIIKAVQSAL